MKFANVSTTLHLLVKCFMVVSVFNETVNIYVLREIFYELSMVPKRLINYNKICLINTISLLSG